MSQEFQKCIDSSGIPDFAKFQPSAVQEAADLLEKKADAFLAKIEAIETAEWSNTLGASEDLDFLFQQIWSPFSHLMSVSQSDEMRAAYEKQLPRMVQLGLKIEQNQKLYQLLDSWKGSAKWAQTPEWQQKAMRAERFIADWEEFSGKKAPRVVSPHLPDDEAAQKPKKPKNPRKEHVVGVAREVVQAAGKPLTRDELFEQMPKHGVIIEGQDPPVVFQTMLWRMKSRLIHLKGHGYWLPERPWGPADYDPEKPSESDLNLGEVKIPMVPPIEEFLKAHEGKELKGTVTYGDGSKNQRTEADYDPSELM